MILLGVAAIIGAFSVFSNAIDGSGLSGYVASWQNNTTLTYWNVTYNSTNNILYAGNDKLCTVANGECLTYNWSYEGRESYNPLNDTSGNGRNLSQSGYVFYNSSSRAYQFNRSALAYLTPGNSTVFSPYANNNVSTYSVWAYMNNDQTGEGSSARQYIIAKGVSGKFEFDLHRTNGTGTARQINWNAYNLTGTTQNTLRLIDGYNYSQWYHFAVVYNGTNLSGYVNGVFVSSITLTRPDGVSSANFKIGSRADAVTFNGSISDVRVWSRALSASEIAQVYQNQSVPSSLVAWYPFINQTSIPSGTYKTEQLISSPPPSNPTPGMLWLNIDDNKTYIRGPTNNWVALT